MINKKILKKKTKTKTNKQKENYLCFGWINKLIVCINGFRLDKLWSFLGKRGCLVYICLFCFLTSKSKKQSLIKVLKPQFKPIYLTC